VTTSFSELLGSARVAGGVLDVDCPEDWLQGRSLFGGLQLALAVVAMRSLVPAVPLRTLQTTFLAPVPAGPVRVVAEVLRTGKSATHVGARLLAADATLAQILGVFGAARPSRVAVLPAQPAVHPAGEPFDLVYTPGVLPAFTQHFRARWLRGEIPFSGGTSAEHVIEVGMHDDGAASEAHLVAIADFIPPVALSHLTERAFGSTLTWMLELLSHDFAVEPLAGWRVDAELVAARDGYTSQSVMVWTPSGRPAALSRQSMLVFG
jgi:acyl-CoA thioesterase